MAKERKGILSAYAVFLVFNAAFFMMDTVNSYFSIYLNDLGFTKTMIGTVTTVSALTAMAMQPVFGAMLDRSASRTRVLQGLILLTAAMYPLLLLNSGFAYILAVYTVYNVFRRLMPCRSLLANHHAVVCIALKCQACTLCLLAEPISHLLLVP